MEKTASYVTLMITSFQDITKFTRKDKETINLFCTRFLAMENDYLEACNKKNHSQVSSILAMFLMVNTRLPHHLLMVAKHELSSKDSSNCNMDHEFLQVKKHNISSIAFRTSQLLDIGDRIELLSISSSAQDEQLVPSLLLLHLYIRSLVLASRN